MAKVGISISIDVLKIEKARLIQGAKGKYLDLTAFVDLDEQGQYGDNGMVVQSVSKDERQQGVKGPILGNVKVFYREDGQQQAPQQQQQQQNYAPQGVMDDSDTIPF